MLNGKAMIILLIDRLIKKMLSNRYIKMSEYFLNLYKPFGDISVKLDLSTYATKTDLK